MLLNHVGLENQENRSLFSSTSFECVPNGWVDGKILVPMCRGNPGSEIILALKSPKIMMKCPPIFCNDIPNILVEFFLLFYWGGRCRGVC